MRCMLPSPRRRPQNCAGRDRRKTQVSGGANAAPIARRVFDYWLLNQYPNEAGQAVRLGQATAPQGKTRSVAGAVAGFTRTSSCSGCPSVRRRLSRKTRQCITTPIGPDFGTVA